MTSTVQEQLQAVFPPDKRDALDRIILRARADLDYTLETIGTCAPSTIKRATAVQMALDGKEPSAVALAVGLSESRVEQVLANVIAVGIPALYPSFAETVPLPEGMTNGSLWGIISPIIQSTPPDRGVRAGAWNPAIVVDFLIHNKTLPDASIEQIEKLIKAFLDPQKIPPSFQYADADHQPPGRFDSLGPLIGFFMGIGLIAIGLNRSAPALLFGLLLTVVAGLSLVKRVLEWRLLRKVVAKKKGVVALDIPAGTPAAVEPVSVNPVSPPKITILHALNLPATPWDPANITDHANAIGQPPLRVLYLWVFAAQYDQGGFETEGWPQLGSVHLLLNAMALTIGELASAATRLLVSDQPTLDRTIASYSDRPGTYDRPKLFITGSTGKYIYHGYPIHTLVCNDAVWKPALLQLAARCDLAVVNVSGFNPSHPGLEFEIRYLFSGGPPSRFVFIYERTTDADAVISSVLSLWSKLETPPTATPELIFLRVPDSQAVGYAIQFQRAIFGTKWLAKVHLDREGEYVPIAARILSYLDRLPNGRAAS